MRCPLCNERAVQFWHEESLSVDYSDRFETRKDEYYVCESCGFIYLWPRPRLGDYYSRSPVPHTSNAVLAEYKSPEFQRTVDFILRHVDLDGGRVIEVGAASGDLLRRIESKTGADVVGVEASQECCEYSRAQDTAMIHARLEEVGDLEPADLVLCCHTLEHVEEPMEFLAKLASLVRPSGHMYLEVPSTRILATMPTPRCGRVIHHLHLNHFLASNLSSACETLGLTPVVHEDDPGTDYPSLKALFVKEGPAEVSTGLFLGQVGMNEEWCETARQRIVEGAVLWGAGQDLFHLVKSNPVSGVLLVDGNPDKQGKEFVGLKVQDPEDLDWTQVDHVIITPSSQALQLTIREDVDRLCPGVKCSTLF